MDLFYASIGKALELTQGQRENQETSIDTEDKSSGLWTYVVASLAPAVKGGSLKSRAAAAAAKVLMGGSRNSRAATKAVTGGSLKS